VASCSKAKHQLIVSHKICYSKWLQVTVVDVAKWPGSNHDSFILLTSAIHDKFERGKFGYSWLLGDSGYPLMPWLITPITTSYTPAKRKFNVLHRKTCCLVERAFHVLKSRWKILDHTRGSLYGKNKEQE